MPDLWSLLYLTVNLSDAIEDPPWISPTANGWGLNWIYSSLCEYGTEVCKEVRQFPILGIQLWHVHSPQGWATWGVPNLGCPSVDFEVYANQTKHQKELYLLVIKELSLDELGVDSGWRSASVIHVWSDTCAMIAAVLLSTAPLPTWPARWHGSPNQYVAIQNSYHVWI